MGMLDNSEQNEAGLGCVLPFDTDEPMFAYGFECGALWADLEAHPDEELITHIHGRNTEMVMRMAEALGREVQATPLDDDCHWMEARFSVANEDLIEREVGQAM